MLAGMVHYAKGTKAAAYKGRFLAVEKVGPGVTVYRCHVSESYNRSFLGRFWAYLSFLFSAAVVGLLRVPRPDVIVASSPPLTVAGTMWVLSACFGSPAVFEVRDLWPESAVDTGVLTSRPLIWLSYRLEELAYRRSVWLNALTPAFVERLAAKKHVPRRRISMIPNGADLDLLQPGPRDNAVRRRLGLEGKFVVSYFGAHGRANRLGQLLDAAEVLRDDADVRILLVGDGMEKPALKAEARRRGLHNVLFADPVPKRHVGDYINASDVCAAVLMKNDTFKTVYPNKIFDYMSCKRPILLAIDGAARELIERAGAGVYVEPENPEALARCVLEMKGRPDVLKRMGESGYRYVREHFSRRRLAETYLAVLADVCSASARCEARPPAARSTGNSSRRRRRK